MKLEMIHEDERGSISLLTDLLKYPEITVFKTYEGFARGGCVHNIHNEFCCIAEGVVEYHIGNTVMTVGEGQSVIIKKGTPHYYIALTDCTVLEWGADPDEKKEKHSACRAIVERINNEKLSEKSVRAIT